MTKFDVERYRGMTAFIFRVCTWFRFKFRQVCLGGADWRRYVVPGHIPIQYSKLPAVVMFPAKDKEPPYICAH